MTDNITEHNLTNNNINLIKIGKPNISNINNNDTTNNNIITEKYIHKILPIKSPIVKRKENNTNHEQKIKYIEKIPIYNYKFNELIKSYTTNNTTINTHTQIIDNILELYIKHGQHTVAEYIISTPYTTTETDTISLLQYSINCAINITNSNDIIFYHDKIRDLICCIAFLSNIRLILGEEYYYEYLVQNGCPTIICKLINNVYTIMAYHSSKGNIKSIQNIIDNINNTDNIDTLEYKELSFLIYKCMQTKICNTRNTETECYLYGFIKPKLINVLQSF
jgi:hypothetical protein